MAADRGHPEGCNSYGLSLLYGEGVEKNAEEANTVYKTCC